MLQRLLRKMLHVKPEFMSVVDADKRTYQEKWEDKEYLLQVREIEGNKVFRTEVLNQLAVLRDKADMAKTPDQLLGYCEGIAAIKNILYAPIKAKYILRAGEEND